jgi:HKD family nuclease
MGNTSMELIDCTMFTIDFDDRKFIAIRLDPENDFNVTVRIATSTHNVCISPDFLRRLYSLMGNILSIITNSPVKTHERLFLKDETNTLSKTSYCGNNMLVIDSHSRDGSRVLLSRKNLLKLEDL